MQSSWSSAGGNTSVVEDDGSGAASQDSPLTAGKSEKDNVAVYMHGLNTLFIYDLISVISEGKNCICNV